MLLQELWLLCFMICILFLIMDSLLWMETITNFHFYSWNCWIRKWSFIWFNNTSCCFPTLNRCYYFCKKPNLYIFLSVKLGVYTINFFLIFLQVLIISLNNWWSRDISKNAKNRIILCPLTCIITCNWCYNSHWFLFLLSNSMA